MAKSVGTVMKQSDFAESAGFEGSLTIAVGVQVRKYYLAVLQYLTRPRLNW